MIGLYFGGGVFRASFGNVLGNLELDATMDESHEWTAEATSNPVEEGSPVTDHIIEQPDKLKLRGVVTDAPTVLSNTAADLIGSLVGSRSQDAFELLRAIIKQREPVTVYTKHRIYPDMVLTSLNIPRTPTDGEAIEFTAEFIHLRKVATQIVDVPPGISAKDGAKASAALVRKTQPSKDNGRKQAETKFFQLENNQSTASRVFNAFSGRPPSKGLRSVPYNPN
jgi:hypothetical protein